jgi:hypothetical protein
MAQSRETLRNGMEALKYLPASKANEFLGRNDLLDITDIDKLDIAEAYIDYFENLSVTEFELLFPY